MSVANVRRELDRVDGEIAALIVERAKLVQAIFFVKRTAGEPLHNPQREAEIVARYRSAAAAAGTPEDRMADAAMGVIRACRDF